MKRCIDHLRNGQRCPFRASIDGRCHIHSAMIASVPVLPLERYADVKEVA